MIGHEEFLKSDDRFRYALLNRMQTDCDYYFGNGGRSANILWAKDEKKQIQAMKDLWNSFAEDGKPEWLTWDDILSYEAKMIG